ncbi:MAG: GNVR domain-containing protein [Elusimicrobiota bacterium]
MALPVELSLEDYWRILRRRSWLIFFAFIVTVTITGIYSIYQKPVYGAFATLRIEPPPGETGKFGSFGAWDPYTGITTQLQVIESAAVAEAALEAMGTLNDKTPPSQKGTLIAQSMRNTKAVQLQETTLVHINAEADGPEKAAALANAIAQSYIDLDRKTRRQSNEQALKNITRRKAQIEAIMFQLEEDKRRLAEDSPTGSLAAGSLANKLLDMEGRRKVLLDRYMEAHPDVLQLTKQIEVLQRQMKTLPAEGMEAARIERDLRIQETIYTSLAKQFEEQKVASALIVSMGNMVATATPNSKPIRPDRMGNMMFGAILGLILGLILSFLAENLDTSLQTVEDVEKALEMPVLGLIPHIPLADGESEFDLFAWLKVGRHEATEVIRRRLIIHLKPQSPAVEAYHSLRANIESHLQVQTGRSLLFTSSGIGEGKSISSMNFALAAVQSGVRVLLIDGDLRRPALHRMLGVPNDMGLTDVVIGGKPMESALKGVTDFMVGSAQMADPLSARGIENLSLLTAGSAKVSPTEFFKRREFIDLFANAKKQFDWVIFDCPPLLLFADGLLIGPLAHGVVMFYQAGRMARSALKRARDELLTVKARPLGIVLNDVRPKELEPRYGYYRSAEYYDYYTREEDDKKT